MSVSLDTVVVLIATILVFFLQAGLAMIETGITRAKNSGNIIMGKVVGFALSILAFCLFGYHLMFGTSFPGIFGIGAPVVPAGGKLDASLFMIYQAMLCAVTVSIVFGAMAERLKFNACCIYSLFIAAVVYPVSGHWINGGGWLSRLKFHDFAGSTSIQLVGGMAALIGTVVLGARSGKYDQHGNPKAIPGHNMTLSALGVFILIFGWVGLGAGRILLGEKTAVLGTVYANIILSAAAAVVVSMCVTWLRFKKPDVVFTISGAVAGLAAISAGCDVVSPTGAVIIGALAGALTTFGMEFLDKHLHIDDPVGVICMNGLAGVFGTFMVGFFSTKDGLLFGGGLYTTGIQMLGIVAVGIWTAVSCLVVLSILNGMDTLRVTHEEELAGLDRVEHGIANSYADFMPSIEALEAADKNIRPRSEPPEGTIKTGEPFHRPVRLLGSEITRIDILLNESRFEALKQELNHIGITGMTVFNVSGCGMQKGGKEFYRGVEVDMTLLPKLKVEIVVCKVPVELVIQTAKKALYTGNIGDGKIFVYSVENAIKVRTDEEGFDALQDDVHPIPS
ncbi:MAG: ammonium transporter [Ethanoligenens sp.]